MSSEKFDFTEVTVTFVVALPSEADGFVVPQFDHEHLQRWLHKHTGGAVTKPIISTEPQ